MSQFEFNIEDDSNADRHLPHVDIPAVSLKYLICLRNINALSQSSARHCSKYTVWMAYR
jgi:hypothetical protein